MMTTPLLPFAVAKLLAFALLIHLVSRTTINRKFSNESSLGSRFFNRIAVRSSPLKVLVCAEALCPDCLRFVNEKLVPAYKLLGPDVVELKFVPFGNAKINVSNQTVVCQHGAGECDANSYEQCIIAAYPDPHQYLPMISCVYDALPMGRRDTKFTSEVFYRCADTADLYFPRIQGCHDNPKIAWRFTLQAAKATPDYHDHVPWIEIDGNHFDEERQDFVQELCKAFKANGGSHPACDTVSGHATSGLMRAEVVIPAEDR